MYFIHSKCLRKWSIIIIPSLSSMTYLALGYSKTGNIKTDNTGKCNFMNCHASYIVNFNYVKSINDKSFIMKNDEMIPISKSLLTTVKKAYIKYLAGD